MKILVADGNRHLRATGYGALSRAILLALTRFGPDKIVVEKRTGKWDDGVGDQAELLAIEETQSLSGIDAVLRIGTPQGKNQYGVPTIVYTQNALGDLPPGWVSQLQEADALIVPGEFDATVFRRYFRNVYICPQTVDTTVFRPMPQYRGEGSERFSFLFVGSYSYRKGVDLLLPAFREAFADGTPVHLRLHCFSGLEKEGVSHLLATARQLPENIEVSVFNGTISPPWMNRTYNQVDAIVSFSRGEGWCMPLHEALLCHRPVVAPDSTAMGEYLPKDGVRRVQVKAQSISRIEDPFGASMRSAYGHPGNVCWEVTQGDAVAALRDVVDNFPEYQAGAIVGAKEIRTQFTLERISKAITAAVHDTLSKRASAAGPVAGVAKEGQLDNSQLSFSNRRRSLLREKRYEEVRSMEIAELQKSPDNPDLWNKAAWTLTAQGKLSQAREALETAVKLAPEAVEYRHAIVKLLTRIGDDAGAAEQLRIVDSLEGGVLTSSQTTSE